jgi:hypothetical protein
LQLADVYSAECERDIVLARNLGFTGQAMPVTLNAGGFSEADFAIPRLDPSERKKIALKGYHGWVDRAKVSLEAVIEMSEELGATRSSFIRQRSYEPQTSSGDVGKIKDICWPI